MTIYKRTEQLIISTNMIVKLEDITECKLKIGDVIEHLLNNESKIVDKTPRYMDLFEVCLNTLEEHKEDIVSFDNHSISRGHRLRPRTFFYPSCRIIRIDLSESSRVATSITGRIPKSNLEEGYEMVPKRGAHSVLIIKIERMTDVSCFATWSLVN